MCRYFLFTTLPRPEKVNENSIYTQFLSGNDDLQLNSRSDTQIPFKVFQKLGKNKYMALDYKKDKLK